MPTVSSARKHRNTVPRESQMPFSAFGLGVAVLVLVALIWDYWPAVVSLFKDWQRDQNYSVGQLVPLAAIWLLWHERKALAKCRISPCWPGLALILLAQAARAYGVLFSYESAERYSLVLTIIGLVLFIAGRHVFWRVRWILLFLFLMVPLPGRIHNLISGPLQTHATTGAVFLLEVFGVNVVREGNVIVLNSSVQLAVAEACSGLRMLTAFVVVASVLAYLVDRPTWQKATVVISSVPVAIICNLARLVITAVLYLLVSGEIAERFFHDFAGLTMMPLAVFILVGELLLFNKLVVPDEATAKTLGTRARLSRKRAETDNSRRKRLGH